jgi:cyclopropane-fatty-acyl-phospholipid synthase
MNVKLNLRQQNLVNILASTGIQIFHLDCLISSDEINFFVEFSSQDMFCAPGKLVQVLDSILATKTLGLGESYIKGYFSCEGGLNGLFEMLYRLAKTDDFGTLPAIDQIPNSFELQSKVLLNKAVNFSRIFQSEVATEHYDLPTQLYEYMLGKTRKYTCGDWTDLPFSESDPSLNLDIAQNQSLAYIIDQLNLGDIEKPVILDCGCGWGAIAQYLLDTKGEGNFIYIGVTIAQEQVRYNQDKFAGVGGVHFYNHSFHDSFDTILHDLGLVKVDGIPYAGSLEHAGPTSTKYILEDVWKILRPSGHVYVQIVGADHKVSLLDPFIDKYIFANTVIMSPGQVGRIIENLRAYTMVRMDNTPQYYYKTLLAWHANFQANWLEIEPHIARVLHQTGFKTVWGWKRHWEFYLLECAAFYKAGTYPQLYRFTVSKNLDPKSQRSFLYPVIRKARQYFNV